MMSDNDCGDDVEGRSSKKSREHYNISERKRRDLIKDSFTSLKDTVPSLKGDKPASRAQILRKASEYIQHMKNKNDRHQEDINNLNRQNAMLEYQIRKLDRFKETGNYTMQNNISDLVVSETDSADESEDVFETLQQD